jgi:hypothetical protein
MVNLIHQQLWSQQALNPDLERGHFDDGWMLLDEQVSRIATVIKDHVGLPVLAAGDALVDAPPEKMSRIQGPMLFLLFIFFANKSAKIGVWGLKQKAKLRKNLIITLFFSIFSLFLRKSQKIVIIT